MNHKPGENKDVSEPFFRFRHMISGLSSQCSQVHEEVFSAADKILLMPGGNCVSEVAQRFRSVLQYFVNFFHFLRVWSTFLKVLFGICVCIEKWPVQPMSKITADTFFGE